MESSLPRQQKLFQDCAVLDKQFSFWSPSHKSSADSDLFLCISQNIKSFINCDVMGAIHLIDHLSILQISKAVK